MKKSVLVVAANMQIGGAERALLGFLDAFDTSKYDLDLFIMHHDGPFLQYIPDKVKLLPQNSKYACLHVPYSKVMRQGHWKLAIGRLKGKYQAKRFLRKHSCTGPNSVTSLYSYKYTVGLLPEISDKEYDLAIGFTTPYYIVAAKTKAHKKVVWIHTDYSKEFSDRQSEEKSWSEYQRIFGVSASVCEAFVNKYPSLSQRVDVMENIVSPKIIQNQSEEFAVSDEMSDDGSIKLLSVGRFTHAKNFDNVPEICSMIRSRGVNVKWYLIGYGGAEDLIKSKIQKFGMEDYVIILGKKDNPYPYIKSCDIYVQPSRFEGKCVSVREAQILHKPVVITNYTTALSQLTDGVDGIIVPMDNEGCAQGITSVIQDKDLQNRLVKRTLQTEYSNNSEIKKIYRLLD